MGRAKRIFTSDHPYHITARCINKDWFKLPMDAVWNIFCDNLYFIHYAYEAEIHAFVLMHNHFHLVVTTPLANIDKVMWHLMSNVSREITDASGRINQTFGGPYYSSVIGSDHHLSNVYKYVYRNPVEAGLCTNVENYKYSTLNGLLGFSPIKIPMTEDSILFNDPSETLRWLNEGYKDNHLVDIETALTKRLFTLPRHRETREQHRLETERC